MAINNGRPWDVVHADATAQTLKHLTRALEDAEDKGIHFDLELQPVMQAVTPNDAAHKTANTGSTPVVGSPSPADAPDSSAKSNGITDTQADSTSSNNSKSNSK